MPKGLVEYIITGSIYATNIREDCTCCFVRLCLDIWKGRVYQRYGLGVEEYVFDFVWGEGNGDTVIQDPIKLQDVGQVDLLHKKVKRSTERIKDERVI